MPWICDVLLSNHSVKAYGRDLADFVRHMQAQDVDPLHVTADHVKLYKRALLEAGMKPATVARQLSVLRGTYKQLAAKGLISWEIAQDIATVKAPGVQKNSTPSLTQIGVWQRFATNGAITAFKPVATAFRESRPRSRRDIPRSSDPGASRSHLVGNREPTSLSSRL